MFSSFSEISYTYLLRVSIGHMLNKTKPHNRSVVKLIIVPANAYPEPALLLDALIEL